MTEIKATYLIVVVLLCVLGVSVAFQAILYSQKHNKRVRTQRKWGKSSLFLILDHFQAIYEIELNSHTKSYKEHPELGPPVAYSDDHCVLSWPYCLPWLLKRQTELCQPFKNMPNTNCKQGVTAQAAKANGGHKKNVWKIMRCPEYVLKCSLKVFSYPLECLSCVFGVTYLGWERSGQLNHAPITTKDTQAGI